MSLETVFVKQELEWECDSNKSPRIFKREWEHAENEEYMRANQEMLCKGDAKEFLVRVKLERQRSCSEDEEKEGCNASKNQTYVKEEREWEPELDPAEASHKVKRELLSPEEPQLQNIAHKSSKPTALKTERRWSDSNYEKRMPVKEESEGCDASVQQTCVLEPDLVPADLVLGPVGPQLQDIAFLLAHSKRSALKQAKAKTVGGRGGAPACRNNDSLDSTEELLVPRASSMRLKNSSNSEQKSFNKKSSLKNCSNSPRKTKLKSRQIRTEKRSFTCDFCGKQFARKQTFIVHIEIHMGIKKYFCRTCNKECTNSFNLKRHEYTHMDHKPFSCELCNKQFVELQKLTVHMQGHTGEKPFFCDICKKRFRESYQLINHKQLHVNLKSHEKLNAGHKPFSCEICKKAFSKMSNLNRHNRVHTGEKAVTCDICKKGFYEVRNLKKHIVTHTVRYRRTRKDKGTYICKICNKQFKCNQALRSHSRVHTGEKPFSCEICQKLFASSSNLKKHILVHKGVKPYACKLCTKRYSDLRCLKKHELTHTEETEIP